MRRFQVIVALLMATASMDAEEAKPLAPYLPERPAQAPLRLWGDRHLQAAVDGWKTLYLQQSPSAEVEAKLLGNGTGMPALYLGLADIALFGRDTIVTDDDGFLHVRNYRPVRVDLGNGSVATPGRSPALVIAVSATNPLSRLSLRQVEAVFSSVRTGGGGSRIRTWGDLGVGGAWATKEIHLYGPDPESMVGLFFSRVALGGSHRLYWEHYTEARDLRQPDGFVLDATVQVARALAADPWGMGVTTLPCLESSLKPVALASSDDAEAFLPSKTTVADRRYPLTRPLFALVDKRPGRAVDRRVTAFLTFLLSDEGQRTLELTGGYVPLSPRLLADERLKVSAL